MDEDEKNRILHEIRCNMFGEPYYMNRKGEGISLDEWSQLFEDVAYRTVARTEIPATSKYGPTQLVTVWMGINMSFLYHSKMIFETARCDLDVEKDEMHVPANFPHPDDGEPCDQARWSTEEQALKMHGAIVRLIQVTERRP